MKTCTMCGQKNANGRIRCFICGNAFYYPAQRKVLSLSDAIKLLMQEATRSGNQQLRAAWAVCFHKVNGYEPSSSDYTSAGFHS